MWNTSPCPQHESESTEGPCDVEDVLPCPCAEDDASLWLQGLQTCSTELPHLDARETRLGAGQTTLGPPTIDHQPQLGVEDAIIYPFNRVYAHLDELASVMFFGIYWVRS